MSDHLFRSVLGAPWTMDTSPFASLELRSAPKQDRSELVMKAIRHFDAKVRSSPLSQAMAETVAIAVCLGLTDEECDTVYQRSDMPSGSRDGFLKGVQRKRRDGVNPDRLAEFDRTAARQKKEQLRSTVSQWFLQTKHDMGWDDVIGNEDARPGRARRGHRAPRHPRRTVQALRTPRH